MDIWKVGHIAAMLAEYFGQDFGAVPGTISRLGLLSVFLQYSYQLAFRDVEQ